MKSNLFQFLRAKLIFAPLGMPIKNGLCSNLNTTTKHTLKNY